jgi:DNA-binding NtrC family response regulator
LLRALQERKFERVGGRKPILKVLEETKGNKYQAAKKLGITRSPLYGKLRRHGIIAIERG